MPPRRSRRAQTFPLTVSAVDDGNIALRVVIVVLGVLLLGAAFYYSAHHREVGFGGDRSEPAERVGTTA
jgi:hypothetical protein